MSDDFVAYRITKDFKSVRIQLPGESITSNPEYPSDWFKDKPNQKPPVSIPGKIENAETWSKMLGSALEDVITPSLAVRFVYEFALAEYTGRLAKDWSSYGVSIGVKDEVITPLSLLDCDIDTFLPKGKEGSPIDAEGKKRLFFIILAGYRYGLASEILQGDYRASILGKINTVLKEQP